MGARSSCLEKTIRIPIGLSIAWVIIYLTFLPASGYAWAGVTGWDTLSPIVRKTHAISDEIFALKLLCKRPAYQTEVFGHRFAKPVIISESSANANRCFGCLVKTQVSVRESRKLNVVVRCLVFSDDSVRDRDSDWRIQRPFLRQALQQNFVGGRCIRGGFSPVRKGHVYCRVIPIESNAGNDHSGEVSSHESLVEIKGFPHLIQLPTHRDPLQSSEQRVERASYKNEHRENGNQRVRVFWLGSELPPTLKDLNWIWLFIGSGGLLWGAYGIILLQLTVCGAAADGCWSRASFLRLSGGLLGFMLCSSFYPSRLPSRCIRVSASRRVTLCMMHHAV